MVQRNPNHHLIDGKHPSILFGFQPSFWWYKVSSIHSSISASWSLSLFRNLSAFSVSNQSLFAVSGSFWAYERPDVSWPCGNQRMDLGSFGGFLWVPNPKKSRDVLRPMLGITFQKSPTWRKHVTPCEPWCWNMHTYIYPQKWHKFVGKYSSSMVRIWDLFDVLCKSRTAENARKWVGPYPLAWHRSLMIIAVVFGEFITPKLSTGMWKEFLLDVPIETWDSMKNGWFMFQWDLVEFGSH